MKPNSIPWLQSEESDDPEKEAGRLLSEEVGGGSERGVAPEAPCDMYIDRPPDQGRSEARTSTLSASYLPPLPFPLPLPLSTAI